MQRIFPDSAVFLTLHEDMKLLDIDFLGINLVQINCTKKCIDVQVPPKPTLFGTQKNTIGNKLPIFLANGVGMAIDNLTCS